MIKNAIAEIRLHPGRIIATLIAIAISIGFMAGTIVFIATIRDTTAKSQNLPLSQADIVITGDLKPTAVDVVKAQIGVKSTASQNQSYIGVRTETGSRIVTFYQVPSDDFAWAEPVKGRWPNSRDEIALSPQAAKALGVELDGLVYHESEQQGQQSFRVVGITNDPNIAIAMTSVGYLVPENTDVSYLLLVKATDGTDLAALSSRLAALGPSLGEDVKVELASTMRQDATNAVTGDFDIMKNMLLAFAAISLVVGMIIVTNTFNILITQRRQQIGLLKAVGATGSQIRRQLLTEATIIGLIGSTLGIILGTTIAAIGAWLIDSLHWGLTTPPTELTICIAIGTITTVISALAPSIRATRISPMEALQTIPTEQQAKRITRIRYLICTTFAIIGIALTYQAITTTKNNIIWAIGAGATITIAVLGAAPIYIPPLIRALGTITSGNNPTARLATANSVRNPQRSAATATALMLAIGLIVTLQIAIATMRTTALEGINNRYPVSMILTSFSEVGLPEKSSDKAKSVPGVKEVVAVPGAMLNIGDAEGQWRWAIAPGDVMNTIAPDARQQPPTNEQAYVDPYLIPENYDGKPVEVTGPAGTLHLKLVPSRFASRDTVLVSPDNLNKLVTKTTTPIMWLTLKADASIDITLQQMQTLASDAGASLSGSFAEKHLIEKTINVLLATMTALLGVAVVVALVGVANTLSLSVIERTRESALLRALGMQKTNLRAMLLIEALLITGAGTLVGVASGAFFGWLGTTSAYKMLPKTAGQPLVFSIDWLYTGGMLLIAITAAALASILPGRKAANATPTEALAAD